MQPTAAHLAQPDPPAPWAQMVNPALTVLLARTANQENLLLHPPSRNHHADPAQLVPRDPLVLPVLPAPAALPDSLDSAEATETQAKPVPMALVDPPDPKEPLANQAHKDPPANPESAVSKALPARRAPLANAVPPVPLAVPAPTETPVNRDLPATLVPMASLATLDRTAPPATLASPAHLARMPNTALVLLVALAARAGSKRESLSHSFSHNP